MAMRSLARIVSGLLLVMAVPSLLLSTLVSSPPGHDLDAMLAAVVDLDQPQSVDGETMNLGRQVVRALVEDTSELRWVQVTEGDARRGVQSGRYAAVATVPADFTRSTLEAARGLPVEAHVSVITSPMIPGAQPRVGRSVAGATSRVVGTAVATSTLDKVYLTFSNADTAFRTAAERASAVADKSGTLDQTAQQAHTTGGQLNSTLGQVTQQASGVGSGPGLPTVDGTAPSKATRQAGQQHALSAESQRLITQAAEESKRARTAGAQSLDNVAELSALARQLDAQASRQQAGVDGYTASVAAVARRQQGMDESLTGIRTQLASFSTQLKGVGRTLKGHSSKPSVSKASDPPPETLEDALAGMQALVTQLEQDSSVARALELATDLDELAEGHHSGISSLQSRLEGLRQLYSNNGNDSRLPVACPAAATAGPNSEACRYWRQGVVAGLGLALDELSASGLPDQAANLDRLAGENLTAVTAISQGRDRLLTGARAAVVVLQRAVEDGTPAEQVIAQVAAIADDADALSSTAQQLSSTSHEQSRALAALDADSPAVRDLSTTADSLTSTLTQQDDTLATLLDTVSDLGAKLDQLSGQVDTLNRRTAELQQAGTGLRATLRQIEANQQQLDQDLASAQHTIDQQDARLNQLGVTAAEAQAAGRALADQLEQMRRQSAEVKNSSASTAEQLQNRQDWPTLDPENRQRITALLDNPPAVTGSSAVDRGWTALMTTVAIWLASLVGMWTLRALSRQPGQGTEQDGAPAWRGSLRMPAVLSVVVAGTVLAWLLPQLDQNRAGVAGVVVVASVAAAALAHALGQMLGPAAGTWAGLVMLGVTVLGFSGASPSGLEAVRDWTVTSPMLDALRIAMTDGSGVGPRVGTMALWAVSGLVLGVLAGMRLRRVAD